MSVRRTTDSSLALVPETEGRLWSVRTWAGTYLVAQTRQGLFDVHRLEAGSAGVGIEYVGEAGSQMTALQLVQDDLDGN